MLCPQCNTAYQLKMVGGGPREWEGGCHLVAKHNRQEANQTLTLASPVSAPCYNPLGHLGTPPPSLGPQNYEPLRLTEGHLTGFAQLAVLAPLHLLVGEYLLQRPGQEHALGFAVFCLRVCALLLLRCQLDMLLHVSVSRSLLSGRHVRPRAPPCERAGDTEMRRRWRSEGERERTSLRSVRSGVC